MAVDDTVLSNGQKMALYDKGYDDGENDAIAVLAMHNGGVVPKDLDVVEGPVFLNGIQQKNKYYLMGYERGFRDKTDNHNAIVWLEASVGLAAYEMGEAMNATVKRVAASFRNVGETVTEAARRLSTLTTMDEMEARAQIMNWRADQMRREIRGE